MVIDWFSAVMEGAIKMSSSPIGGANEFSCMPKSVKQETCCATTFFYKHVLNILVGERVLDGSLWKPTWNSFQGSKGVVNKAVVNLFLYT